MRRSIVTHFVLRVPLTTLNQPRQRGGGYCKEHAGMMVDLEVCPERISMLGRFPVVLWACPPLKDIELCHLRQELLSHIPRLNSVKRVRRNRRLLSNLARQYPYHTIAYITLIGPVLCKNISNKYDSIGNMVVRVHTYNILASNHWICYILFFAFSSGRLRPVLAECSVE